MSITLIDRRRLAAMIAGAAFARPGAATAEPVAASAEADGGSTHVLAGADLARRMTVPVWLNGKGGHALVVDSGANRTVLALEVAQALGLARGEPENIHGIAGVEPAPTAVLERLMVGDLTVRDIRTPLLPRSRLGADGLLGVDVLSRRRVRMDFHGNRMVVSSRRGFEVVTNGRGSRLTELVQVVVPARFRFGQLIIIDADIGGLAVTCFLDSGSENTVGNLALWRSLGQAYPALGEQRVRVTLVSATGQTASGDLAPLPGLRMGGLRIGNLSAVFADLHIFDVWDLKDSPSLLIGIDVMRHFRGIELDFLDKQVVFLMTPTTTLARPDSGQVQQ